MAENKVDLKDLGFDKILTQQPSFNGAQTNFQVAPVIEVEVRKEFSPEKQQYVGQLKNQIVTTDPNSIVVFGMEAQQQLSKVSHTVLEQSQKQEVQDISKNLDRLIKQLEDNDPDVITRVEKNPLKRLFKKAESSIQEMLLKMNTTAVQIDKIGLALENSKDVLLYDARNLEDLYQANSQYYELLELYIEAAKQRKFEIEQEIQNANIDSDPEADSMDIQKLNDLKQFITRLDKRIYDLEISKQITLQSGPQIRMIQDVNQALAEKVQSSVLTAIPLWKNQMGIAMTLVNQRKVAQSQEAVARTTNELLLKNSEMLKTNTIRVAQANEQGLVQIETLKKTQNDIIETIKETMRIQNEGAVKRKDAQIELAKMEGSLKQQLLEVQNQHQPQIEMPKQD